MADINQLLKIIYAYKRATTDIEKINLETTLFNRINGELKRPFLDMLVDDLSIAAKLRVELDDLKERYREVVQQRNDYYDQVQGKKKVRRLGPIGATRSKESSNKKDPEMKETLKDPSIVINLLDDAIKDERMELTKELEVLFRLRDHGISRTSNHLEAYKYTTISKAAFCKVIDILKEHLTRLQVISLLCNVKLEEARDYRFTNVRNNISSKWHGASLQYSEPYGWIVIQVRTGWLQKKIAEECK